MSAPVRPVPTVNVSFGPGPETTDDFRKTSPVFVRRSRRSQVRVGTEGLYGSGPCEATVTPSVRTVPDGSFSVSTLRDFWKRKDNFYVPSDVEEALG